MKKILFIALTMILSVGAASAQKFAVVDMDYILKNIDYLIDGRYEEELRDVTLYLRGSSNQRIHKFDREKKL